MAAFIRATTPAVCASDKWAYLCTICKVLCPKMVAISSSDAPCIARYEANVCWRSWKRKLVIPAHWTELAKASLVLSGFLRVASGKTREVSKRLPFACCFNKSKAKPVQGTALRSPFLVSWKVSVPRFRSTSGQRSESSSPLLAPVEMAKTTMRYRYRFRLCLQAASKRSRSSSVRKRTRPRGSLGFLTLLTGFSLTHCHSTARLNAWLSTARYRHTVEFFRVLASLSRYATIRAGVISESA